MAKPGGGDAEVVDVKGEVPGVFYKLEKMRVASGELARAMDAEGVVPDDPASTVEPAGGKRLSFRFSA
jgi:hypothetical protein